VAFIEWLAIAFWPITALAVVLAWRPMRRMWSARNNLFVVIAVLSIFALIIILTGVIGNQTAVSVFDVAVLFSLVGGSWLWLVVKVARRARILMTTLNLFFALAFLTFGLLWLADFVLPRRQVEGTVDKVYENVSRSGWHYHVLIDGRHHPTTADVFTRLRQGDHVRATIGAATGLIFRTDPL
jgi:TRAP-type C4-dicarboxylate transport system permease large subunit